MLKTARMVEDFVQKNPGFKGELDILMQYKLVPDEEIVFEGKDQLNRHVSDDSEGNPETVDLRNWLLLYVDNELNVDERIKVEEQLCYRSGPAKRTRSFVAYQNISPEEITFPG